MNDGTCSRRRNASQIVCPLNSVNGRTHRGIGLRRVQHMLEVQGHVLSLSISAFEEAKPFKRRKVRLYASVVPFAFGAKTVDFNLVDNSFKDGSDSSANEDPIPDLKTGEKNGKKGKNNNNACSKRCNSTEGCKQKF